MNKLRTSVLLLVQCVLAAAAASAQTVPATPPPLATPPAETHITQQQAKELFRSVDEILQFASNDSKLATLKTVKRRLTTRDEVEKYLAQKFSEDESAKRLQRSEIVLKKFGLLDRDFQLSSFLLSLLKEQIAGYYDNKTKTVNLLDYVPPDAQKPVLAHELTHALQDQHTDLTKWQNQSLNTIAKTVKEDNEHISRDEVDTARDAVLEGQAMVVFFDYALRDSGKTLQQMPQTLPLLEAQMGDSSDSPMLARAPLILKESLIFPYREGVGFVGSVLGKSGQEAAFAGTLDRPPSSSFEILHPDAYLDRQKVPVLPLPDLHTLLDAQYEPYDVGVMGEVDVRMLSELFGGHESAQQLSPAWRGGVYYAAQRKTATPAERATTASLGLIYLSAWETPAAARNFAKLYTGQLPRKYRRLKAEQDEGLDENEKVFATEEGPAIVIVSGTHVLTLEGFDLPLARKLELALMTPEQDGDTRIASAGDQKPSISAHSLTGELRGLIESAGMMRCALHTPLLP